MADSYKFLKDHYDRIQSEERSRDRQCGEDHIIGERPNDCFACLSEQRDELLACLRRMCGMYGAYSKRLAPLLAESEGTVWTFERANELACEAIAKANDQTR